MKQELLTHLLCLLRAAHWSHWTSHWQVQGDPFYGDHQMLGRIYEEIEDEIDTLAEKLVGEFGPAAVDPVEQAQHVAELLSAHADDNPIARALSLEESLQEEIADIYAQLKEHGGMSLGLDDFIMSVANAHETFVYLLRQKTRLHKTAGRIIGTTVANVTPTRVGTRALDVGPRGELARADTARLIASLAALPHQHLARG